MSANTFKRLNVSDTFVVPYTANKSWDIDSGSFADQHIVINVGTKYTGTFDPETEYFTNNQYDCLVYKSINFSYYPTFYSKVVSTSSLQNTVYNDGTLSTSSYWKGINTHNPGNLDTVKFFPTGNSDVIYVINVPKTLTGDKILPTTFELTFVSASTTCKLYDDGNYNLLYSGSNISSSINTVLSQSSYVGNVFYEQNVTVITVIPNNVRTTAWRGTNPYCVQASGNTGYLAYTDLELYYIDNSVTTGVTKINDISDPDYVAPVLNLVLCPLPSATPSVTPSISITPSVTSTPSVTPTVTPSVTPSVSVTPSITPSISVTPSFSVSISVTPSVTPSTTPNFAPVVINTQAYIQPCVGGSCNDYLGWYIVLNQNVLVDTYYSLNIDLYTSGIYAYTYSANGIIPAGTNLHNSDPCLGGGTYIGCGYLVNSVCIATIDAPVDPSTYSC
jgi:hypothetical protein